ncbi:MAG: hypothetical protein K2V38_03930, partial [Gemmataceae bacterium]|nr:hypothetical protein [Gemmataceae bacterium]
AAPWVIANHAINYAVGGVWVPLGMVPEYLDWPGSPFHRGNMTGLSRHTPAGFAYYAGSLLTGPHGFVRSNLPVALAIGFGWRTLRRPFAGRVELVALLGWCVVAWLVYSVLSDNYGGGCASVRWFVPFLVPLFWLLARLLAERPGFRPDFAVLAGFGLVLAYRMWEPGPWVSGPERSAGVAGPAVVVWSGVRAWQWRRARAKFMKT